MRMLSVLLVALLSAGTARAAVPDRAVGTAAGPQSVASLPLVGNGLGADELNRAERTIRAEVDARFAKRSLKESTMRARLDDGAAAGLRCDRSQVSCLVQLGIVTQTDLVLLAIMVPQRESATLALRLVDVGTGAQAAYAESPVASPPLGEEVSALLAALDAPAARALRLEVRGPAGSAVAVDGSPRGTLPLAALTDVSAGRHEVRVVVAGAEPFVANVELRAGEPVVVDVPAPSLVESTPLAVAPVAPAPAGPSVTSLATMGAGVGVAVLGGAAVVVGVAPYLSFEAHASDLERLDAEIGSDPALLTARADEVRTKRALLDADAAAWEGYGMFTMVAGAAVVAVGAAVVTVGAVVVE